jgi:hypothetical protein
MNDPNDERIRRAEAIAKMDRDMVDRWEDYKAKGKHVSAERANTWLAQLETGEIMPLPQPEL